MTQTVGKFLLEAVKLVDKTGSNIVIPAGKPWAQIIRAKSGNTDSIRSWVRDARIALQHGQTPKEYALGILERDYEGLIEALK